MLDWPPLIFNLQIEDHKFDEMLPGLRVFLQGRCPNLNQFVIETPVLSLDMFATEEDLSKYIIL